MKTKSTGFTLVELMIVVAIVGILAAIAIPNFIRFQARSKQAEAKANLRSIYTGERSLFSERDKYSRALGDIGFAPERGNRYSYSITSAALTAANAEVRNVAIAVPGTTTTEGITVDQYRFANQLAAPVAIGLMGTVTWNVTVPGITAPTSAIGGLYGTCPSCSYSASATGNIDNDTIGLDYQTSSSEFVHITQSDCSEVQEVSPGSPGLVKNDIFCD